MNPLSKRIRFRLILISLVIFFIITPIIVSNSFGYKIGFFEKAEQFFTLVKNGGVYIQTDIPNVSIYVDDEYIKDNGRFTRNMLVQDLEPDTKHKITVTKKGFNPWVKTLFVEPSLVVESKVLMLPKEIEKKVIYPFVDDLGNGTTTSPVVTTSAVKKILPIDSTNVEYRELLLLFDLVKDDDGIQEKSRDTTQTKSVSDSVSATTSVAITKKIPTYFTEIGVEDPDSLENLIILNNQVAWLEDGDIVTYWVAQDKTPFSYYCLSSEKCRTKIKIDWDNKILNFNFLPGRNDVFVVLVQDGVYAVEIDDRSQRNIQKIYSGKDLDFRVRGNYIYLKEGYLFYEIDF